MARIPVAGAKLEAARAADQSWREHRTERTQRSLFQVDRIYRPLIRAVRVIHTLVFLHPCGSYLGFNGAFRQALDGTPWESCAWIYQSAVLAYFLGLLPITVCVILYRAGFVRWARQQQLELGVALTPPAKVPAAPGRNEE